MAHQYRDMHLRKPDGSGRGEVRHVKANVAKVFPDAYNHDGADHQHIWIDQVTALDNGADYNGDVFVAVRVNHGGVGKEIPFEVGTPVEMQGDWIPADQATAGQDDPNLPVLHFTHHPVGFIVYGGKTYK